MQSFTFKCPTEIVFGKGAEEQVPEKLKAYGATKILIVYGGGSVVRSGLLGHIESALTAAGLVFTSIGGVKPNPRVGLVREGVRLVHEFGEGHRAWRGESGHRCVGFLVRSREAHEVHAGRRGADAGGGGQRDE